MKNGTFRIETFPPYVLKMVEAAAQAAQDQGRDVIRFGMGIPDGRTPNEIVGVLVDAVRRPENQQYPKANGHPNLIKSIRAMYERDYGIGLDDDQMFVTPGGKPAIGHFCYGAFYPGTPVLAPSPYYPIHDMGPKLAEADVITYPVKPGGDHVAAIAHAYEAAVRKPRFLIANFPHNPTGAIMSLFELKELVRFAEHPERDLFVVYDAAYQRTEFEHGKAPSILEVGGADYRCMEVFSFSKCLNMSGFRVGFVAGNSKMVQALASTDSYLLYGVPSFIQIAAAYGLDHLDDFAPSICNTYARRAMVMQSEFSAVGWPMTAPKSTMFMWTRIPEPFAAMDSFGFAKKLLDEADIAVSPGKGFGEEGEGFVRFALNQSAERIQEAAVRVGKFLKKG